MPIQQKVAVLSSLKTRVFPKDLWRAIVLAIMDGYLIRYKVQTDMSHLGRVYICLLIITLFASCFRDRADSSFADKAELYIETSKKIATEPVYYFVSDAVNDSIRNWASNRLSAHLRETLYDWRIDS